MFVVKSFAPQGQLFYDTCSISKIHRFPFSNRSHLLIAPFELLHIDLWDTYKITSLNGETYFLKIVNDYLRTTWTYLLHDKS